MKKIIFFLSVFFIAFQTQSQEKTQSQEIKKNKNAKISIKVDGICGMCKKRIETAALKTKGVKFALWSPKTHQLNLILDERKTEVANVQQNILKVGHDVYDMNAKKISATDEAYNSVHPCCKYRDEKIVLDHEGELKKVKKNK
ncbi:heavy-metal-associated domain-containing protein [Polaribacter sp.]|uniref:heavy-metal-associated domain-containing protein n=1 Tax=Polaribacter sp. TaxID=1920175 RepID=UPI003F6AC7FD